MGAKTFADFCIEKNRRHAENFDKADAPASPRRKAAVVACMDARIETGRLLGLSEGDAHVIRNAGGVVTDDVLRSLLISQRLLGTEEIVVVQHTECGMLTFRDDELKDEIEADTGLRPSFALESFTHLEENVRRSIRRIQACPFIPVRDKVRGFVYNVRTGLLEEVL